MKKDPSLIEALVPIILLIVLLTANVFVFEDTLAGSNQIALLMAATVGVIIVRKNGMRWEEISDKIVSTIGSAMPAMLILLLIGSLAGTWMISGVVPAMIYYGLDIIHPQIFLFTAVVVASVISVVTGSSWSTVATIGVALLGIGKALGINEAMVAGAIISGAYFGDKMSPLSDTTNLAPAMAGTDLFTHVRYMVYTTTPSLIITLIIFLVIGFNSNTQTALSDVEQVQSAIANNFNTSPILFLVPIALLTIIILKVPPLPSLMIGTLLGGVFAVIFQPEIIQEIAGSGMSYFKASYIGFMQAMFGDVTLSTENQSVNELLKTSGMSGMLDTIWLILSAMVFGGVMEAGGLLQRITMPIVQRAKSAGSLVTSTVISCIFFNATASDQYISIVVPGRMFRKTYEEKGYKPELLSRTLEDSGTMTSVLFPWNTCGATQSRVLGVGTWEYLPYCFFNIISPFMSILFAYLNIKIRRIEKSK
ncbi:MAG: Na+/H+ antiporter NhaC [Bacteroidetes bacterium GWF2_42_66]|nr:MAG: Na+/H+ antiporter NhaC [Bacteroidetes bacterium GWA2_42_15]OFY03604.1 MAG: Na+/H+ antiporter NhaC [Bacteroidetes bacterium GWE2_42_39]OFY45969.1 MAG: Na+/H+ antiporter NhaC [Bacteroidetes bacterium GWF2_42_66]HBL75213.1 Na+/H+ antiporter NhaC [Prolixibacteraceae bacterium]HCR90804.1 Na+/H+ antiporter NhaC [Prolixibacteraceae bacterium]